MRITVLDTAADVALAIASRVVAAVHAQPDLVLGLPAGQTPVAAYAELRRLCAAGEVDFSRASSFNLDEFVGMAPTDTGSFRHFMEQHLLSGVNLRPGAVHSPNGVAPDLEAECRQYDAIIANSGGIGLQLLGVGLNGHIGFNEPAESLPAGTHRVTLHHATRLDNATWFGGDADAVPAEALTMGVGGILGAGRVVLAATGDRKAGIVERLVNGPVTTWVPASLLQLHRDVELLLDRVAAAGLDSQRPNRP